MLTVLPIKYGLYCQDRLPPAEPALRFDAIVGFRIYEKADDQEQCNRRRGVQGLKLTVSRSRRRLVPVVHDLLAHESEDRTQA